MIKSKARYEIARKLSAYLLLCALGIAAVPLGAHAQQAATPRSTTNTTPQQRQRRAVAAPQNQTSQNQTSQNQTSQEPTPRKPLLRAAAVPSASASAPISSALEALRLSVRGVLDEPELLSAITAVKIVSLDSGRTLVEENAAKLLNPASNMKLFTIAAALARLSPDYRLSTSVYALSRPDNDGAIRGDLRIYGRGDPSYSKRFTGTDARAAIDDLAARIGAAGVRRIDGDLVADESYFAGTPLGRGWQWDDLQWYYGAEVSALSVNENSVELSVRPGARAGESCIVSAGALSFPHVLALNRLPASSPSAEGDQLAIQHRATSTITDSNTERTATEKTTTVISNRATTAPRGTPRSLRVHRPLNSNIIEISGTLPEGDNGFTGSIAVSRPALLFASMLRESLARRGIVVTGETRLVSRDDADYSSVTADSLVEIASRPSPPLSTIARETMKLSQNLYTELLLRQLAAPLGSAQPVEGITADAGLEALRSFVRAAGIPDGAVLAADGSGLSRGDFVTADALVRLLLFMDKHPARQAFRDSLPIAGVDGTLRNRLKNTRAAGNLIAKTGTLSHATSLSGYVTTRAGERLAFAFIINNHSPDLDPRTAFTEPLATLLANLNARP